LLFIIVGDTQRCIGNLGVLVNLSTKEDLIIYFELITVWPLSSTTCWVNFRWWFY